MDDRYKVAAVVVTYNRSQSLLQCLHRLINQTRPIDAIFIIDNASSDGTPFLLIEHQFIDKFLHPVDEPLEVVTVMSKQYDHKSVFVRIYYVRMRENVGCAAGFHEGIKRGHEAGYDWLWLMDDDGFPEENALEMFRSLNVTKESCYCSLVIDSLNREFLTFGFDGFWGRERLHFHSMADVNGFIKNTGTRIISGHGNFFNGVFISRQIIDKIGFPRKEMFIWGDENEYLFRMLDRGFKVQIMLDIFFYHPRFPCIPVTFLGKKIYYSDIPATWKYYYWIRNNLYISNKYCAQIGISWPLLKCLLSNLILAIRVKKIRRYILLGLFDQILALPYKSIDQLKR